MEKFVCKGCQKTYSIEVEKSDRWKWRERWKDRNQYVCESCYCPNTMVPLLKDIYAHQVCSVCGLDTTLSNISDVVCFLCCDSCVHRKCCAISQHVCVSSETRLALRKKLLLNENKKNNFILGGFYVLVFGSLLLYKFFFT